MWSPAISLCLQFALQSSNFFCRLTDYSYFGKYLRRHSAVLPSRSSSRRIGPWAVYLDQCWTYRLMPVRGNILELINSTTNMLIQLLCMLYNSHLSIRHATVIFHSSFVLFFLFCCSVIRARCCPQTCQQCTPCPRYFFPFCISQCITFALQQYRPHMYSGKWNFMRIKCCPTRRAVKSILSFEERKPRHVFFFPLAGPPDEQGESAELFSG